MKDYELNQIQHSADPQFEPPKSASPATAVADGTAISASQHPPDGFAWIALAKLEALDQKIFSKRDTIPVQAVKKSISWLLQTPFSHFLHRFSQTHPALMIRTKEGQAIEADVRLLEQLYTGLGRLLGHNVACKEVSFVAKVQSGATVFEFDFTGGEFPSSELQLFKGVVERAFPVKVMISFDDTEGVIAGESETKIAVLLLPDFEPTIRALYFGYFSSTLLQSTVEKVYELEVEAISGLARLPKNRPVLLDLAGLNRARESLNDLSLTSKVIVLGDSLDPHWVDEGFRHFLFSSAIHSKRSEKNQLGSMFLKATAQKFKRKQLEGVAPYLRFGAHSVSTELLKYSDRNRIFESLKNLVRISESSDKPSISDLFTQNLICVAQEMIENAFFHAPRDGFGKKKYDSLRDTEQDLVLKSYEKVTVAFGADDQHVVIAVIDPFGRLAYDDTVKAISRKQGFCQLYELADGLVLNVKPGYQTEVICFFSLPLSLSEAAKDPMALSASPRSATKCFSFFEVGESV